jgi:hypothetical protein
LSINKGNFSTSDENLERRYIVRMEEENHKYFLIIFISFEKEEDHSQAGDIVALNPEESLRIISLRK